MLKLEQIGLADTGEVDVREKGGSRTILEVWSLNNWKDKMVTE